MCQKIIELGRFIHLLQAKMQSAVVRADRTNGRAYATVLRLSVCRLSVCL